MDQEPYREYGGWSPCKKVLPCMEIQISLEYMLVHEIKTLFCTTLRSILLLSAHLCLGATSDLFPSLFSITTGQHFSIVTEKYFK
jgi:hypothetical protein